MGLICHLLPWWMSTFNGIAISCCPGPFIRSKATDSHKEMTSKLETLHGEPIKRARCSSPHNTHLVRIVDAFFRCRSRRCLVGILRQEDVRAFLSLSLFILAYVQRKIRSHLLSRRSNGCTFFPAPGLARCDSPTQSADHHRQADAPRRCGRAPR